MMKMILMISGDMMNSIIFDLDGTLWDVTDVTWESANEIAKKYNLNEVSKKIICDSFGLTRKECARTYFPNLEISKSLKLMDEIAEVKNKKLQEYGGNLYPNVKETLINLSKKYKLYIVSNTAEDEYIEAFLNCSGLKNIFSDYIAASKLNLIKGDAIKKIIEDNNIEKAVYVGDTIKDKEASTYAGIPFIYANYGFGDLTNEKYYINEIKYLSNILDRVF